MGPPMEIQFVEEDSLNSVTCLHLLRFIIEEEDASNAHKSVKNRMGSLDVMLLTSRRSGRAYEAYSFQYRKYCDCVKLYPISKDRGMTGLVQDPTSSIADVEKTSSTITFD